MAEIILTQSEADNLIALPKVRVSNETWNYPGLGGAISIPLSSRDKREQFHLDISRGRIDLRKGRYQNRARQVIVLVRLCFGGPPHRNPDGVEVPSPHFHIYREGYGDKWAMPAPLERFPHLENPMATLDDFMAYCNIVEPPFIEQDLFS